MTRSLALLVAPFALLLGAVLSAVPAHLIVAAGRGVLTFLAHPWAGGRTAA